MADVKLLREFIAAAKDHREVTWALIESDVAKYLREHGDELLAIAAAYEESQRQLAAYRKIVNKIDDRVEYARDSLSRADIHALLAELTFDLVPVPTPVGES